MTDSSSRDKDILLIGISIQLSIFALLVFFPLVFVSVFLFFTVVVNETIRRLDEYSGTNTLATTD